MLIPAFHDWPDEGAIVGRLLAGYGNYENRSGPVRRPFDEITTDDMRRAVRSIFTERNADDRIKLAKKWARQPMQLTGLEEFTEAIAAMGHCKGIRNAFAHCTWTSLRDGLKSDGLFFVNLEDAAKLPGKIVYGWQHASLPRLRQMEQYFAYTRQCLIHLELAMRAQRGRPRVRFLRSMPTKLAPPPKMVAAPPVSIKLLPVDL